MVHLRIFLCEYNFLYLGKIAMVQDSFVVFFFFFSRIKQKRNKRTSSELIYFYYLLNAFIKNQYPFYKLFRYRKFNYFDGSRIKALMNIDVVDGLELKCGMEFSSFSNRNMLKCECNISKNSMTFTKITQLSNV